MSGSEDDRNEADSPMPRQDQNSNLETAVTEENKVQIDDTMQSNNGDSYANDSFDEDDLVSSTSKIHEKPLTETSPEQASFSKTAQEAKPRDSGRNVNDSYTQDELDLDTCNIIREHSTLSENKEDKTQISEEQVNIKEPQNKVTRIHLSY